MGIQISLLEDEVKGTLILPHAKSGNSSPKASTKSCTLTKSSTQVRLVEGDNLFIQASSMLDDSVDWD